jgi:hypothetical protein
VPGVPSLLLSLLLTAAVAANPPPPLTAGAQPRTRAFRYSKYEEATIADALAQLGFTRDDDPEGKIVEAVDTVRLEVIEERDPAPRFLNVFHVVTRSYVVKREALFRPGDVYRQTLADETRRNLAALPQLSLVLVVAADGSAPDRTRIVVITKDVWSLRLNWGGALTSRGIESLTVEPSETNLLGTHQTLGLLFAWLPESYSIGARYAVPRVLGSRVTASVDAGLTFHAPTRAREGSFGDAQVSLPLWSSRTEWSWGASMSWLAEVTRVYSGGRVAAFALDERTDCGQTPALCVPWVYDTDVESAAAFVTRSFGWRTKLDLSLGFAARRGRYRAPDLSIYDPATARAFEGTRIPASDDRVGPYVQLRTYSAEFLRVLDLDSLALQEDFRIGPVASLRLQPVLRALGSTRDLLAVTAGASYTGAIGDGLARIGVDSTTFVRTDGGGVDDGSFQVAARFASPRLAVGRIVVDGVLLNRYANHLQLVSTVGGDDRLRGFPSHYFAGSRFLGLSAEARSLPLQLFESVQVGGVLFYDAADAFDRWKDLRIWQAAGFGARVLFPQLNRIVFRVDVGFPLSRPLPPGVLPVGAFANFGQAF